VKEEGRGRREKEGEGGKQASVEGGGRREAGK
jgi:hypothetical protein